MQADLTRLNARARTMYELDKRKDQIMTVCTLAMANLGMWVRDHYFPPTYAHAMWARLAPFFQLGGWVTASPDAVALALHPFNDRRLRADLTVLCAHVTAAAPRLPDGRVLRLPVHAAGAAQHGTAPAAA